MSNDIDLAADFADSGADIPVLPPLEDLYGSDALPENLDLESMLAIATDPNTPAPEGDLLPATEEPLADEPFDQPSGDDFLPDSSGTDSFEPHEDDNPFGHNEADDLDSGLDDLDPEV